MALAPTNCTTILTPATGGAGEQGPCRPAPAAVAIPRLVRARTLLAAADIEQLGRLARAAGDASTASGSAGASRLLVFSRGDEKIVASIDGLVPSDAVAERLADGQVHSLAKVVGG